MKQSGNGERDDLAAGKAHPGTPTAGFRRTKEIIKFAYLAVGGKAERGKLPLLLSGIDFCRLPWRMFSSPAAGGLEGRTTCR